MKIDYPISLEKARELVKEDILDVIKEAYKLRKKYKEDRVFTCSIINAKSGLCKEDCAFCAQSVYHKTDIKIYPLMDEEEILERAKMMKEKGATRFSIVTSGYKLKDREISKVCKAVELIKKEVGIKVCASLGMLDRNTASKLKDSGLDKYHHNLETARSYFQKICTTHSYDEDIETVKMAKESGLEVCCGGIIGLGENWDQRLELAFTIRELDVDSIPLNFLIPIPGTRLKDMPLLDPLEAIRTIAIFRIINPEKDITICGGREVVLRDLQSWIFLAGANGIMIGDYLTTKGRNIEDDIRMIEDLGLKISES